jgi:hypothetical protein
MGEMTGKTEIKTLAKLIANGHGGAVLDEFRDRARAAGVEGRPGGWIYLSSTAGKPIGQGWAAFATFLLDGLTPKARELRDAMDATPGTPERLDFRPAAGVSSKLLAEGATVYEAERDGAKYRIVGSIVDPMIGPRRTFRAYRVVGTNGHTLVPAGDGGESKTLKSAKRQAELDLVEVLRDRQAQDVAERTEAPACPAGPSCSGAAFPGHPAHYAAEVTFPTPVCPDAEAGKPHAAHRIEGTWREQCRGVEGDDFASAEEINERLMAEAAARGAGDRPTVPEGGARKIAAHLADRRADPPAAPIREALDKVAAAAYEAVEQALAAAADAPQTDPATDDDLDELLDRIVRRAQYVGLRAVLTQLDDWIGTARHNCVANEHGGASSHDDNRLCGRGFDVEDFREMINGAADELRLPRPVDQ